MEAAASAVLDLGPKLAVVTLGTDGRYAASRPLHRTALSMQFVEMGCLRCFLFHAGRN